MIILSYIVVNSHKVSFLFLKKCLRHRLFLHHMFSADKILEMKNYFTKLSDMGKLYLNHLMAETFYHLKNIPDEEYNERIVIIQKLMSRTYKSRVNQDNRNYVIKQNISKVNLIASYSDEVNIFDEYCVVKKA